MEKMYYFNFNGSVCLQTVSFQNVLKQDLARTKKKRPFKSAEEYGALDYQRWARKSAGSC